GLDGLRRQRLTVTASPRLSMPIVPSLLRRAGISRWKHLQAALRLGVGQQPPPVRLERRPPLVVPAAVVPVLRLEMLQPGTFTRAFLPSGRLHLVPRRVRIALPPRPHPQILRTPRHARRGTSVGRE